MRRRRRHSWISHAENRKPSLTGAQVRGVLERMWEAEGLRKYDKPATVYASQVESAFKFHKEKTENVKGK